MPSRNHGEAFTPSRTRSEAFTPSRNYSEAFTPSPSSRAQPARCARISEPPQSSSALGDAHSMILVHGAMVIAAAIASGSATSPFTNSASPQDPGAAPQAPSARAATPSAAAPTPSATPQATTSTEAKFKQEELDQMLAPIALYPDDLLSQVLMASTYPTEIVEADRWVKANKDVKGDAAAKALEAKPWDPSVKSLVNTPPVLDMLSMKLDWTQKLGNAFLGQQAEVMQTVQKLRAKAKENGKLESNENQKVEVEGAAPDQVITIASGTTTVIYVPTYDPVVVYGSWWYPSYPPYPYYPPYYPPGSAALSFGIGLAWGYAWGSCNWGGNDIDIDINRNTNINNNIDRSKYAKQNNLGSGKGQWKHDPAHRGSVPYRNEATAKQFGGRSTADAAKSRESFRGRTGEGLGAQPGTSPASRAGATDRAGGARPTAATGGSRTQNTPARTSSGSSASRGSALNGVQSGGTHARAQSARGQSSRGGGGSRGGRGGGGGRGGRR